MRKITIRIPADQEQRLKHLAQKKEIAFIVCLRQLLEVGEQVDGSTTHQQQPISSFELDQKISSLDVHLANIMFENHYLMRYFIGKFFKEEGKLAKKIAREQAAKDVNEIIGAEH